MQKIISLLPVLAASLVVSLRPGVLNAADWPQYRGLTHNGVSTESIASKWPAAGPRQIWKTPLTDGFSSLTVSQGRAFSLVQREVDGLKQEVCVALDADSGKEFWAAPLGFAKFDGGGDSGTDTNKGGDGPRSTPGTDGANVFVTSAKVVVSSFDAKSGKLNWSRDLMKEHGGENIRWQNAASPLIDGDLIFVAGGGVGQALLALNKKDGGVVWKGQDDKMTHATPTAATILGVRQVIFFTQKGLVAVAPKNGDVLWRYDFRYNVSTASSPIIAGDIVYCSAGYGVGAGAVKITKTGDKLEATELWRKPNQLMNHWSTPVFKDGHLYGMFSFKEYGKGPLKCVELTTGREVWAQEGFGAGNCILVGGNVLALGDAGQLVLVEATPKAYTELARAQVIAGKCWSTPTVSNGRVYARSTKEGVCLDVSGQSAKN